MIPVIVIHKNDNVGVVSQDVQRGETLQLPDGASLRAEDDIPRCHKVSLATIPESSEVVKYGMYIGLAQTDIAAGRHVHIHNVIPELKNHDV